MQRVKPKMNRPQAFALLFLILVIIALGVWMIHGVFSQKPATAVGASKLPCPYSETIRPFGENVLYYDGMSIHCISSTGSVRWSFQIGADADYACTSDTIVAWVGSTVFILDQNGQSSYNDNLGETIQFARVGKQYIAAVIGAEDSPRLLVKDHTGAHMDEEADAYKNLLLLDVGFYGNAGQYMWTLGSVEADEAEITVEHDGTKTLEMLSRVMGEIENCSRAYILKDGVSSEIDHRVDGAHLSALL